MIMTDRAIWIIKPGLCEQIKKYEHCENVWNVCDIASHCSSMEKIGGIAEKGILEEFKY